MKKSQNINYNTPLQSNNIYSKKSNVETCSTTASDKESCDFENDCSKGNITASLIQKENIMLEIEEMLTKANNPQIPLLYFRDIHTHLKNKEFKFNTPISAIFKDCYIKSNKS